MKPPYRRETLPDGQRFTTDGLIGAIICFISLSAAMAKPPNGERGRAWAMCLLRHGLLDLNRGTLLLVWGRHGRMLRDSARWLEARNVLLYRAVLTRERPLDI